jgi:integrase
MARTVRDVRLDSRASREQLPPRGKPYWRELDPGLHIGYRRLKGRPGSWVRRRYVGDSDYETQSFAIADDLSDANGAGVLNFRQAQTEARAWRDHKAQAAAGRGPFTVADAIKLHVEALAAIGRNTADTEFRARAMILPTLGAELVADLTTERLRAWLMNLAELPPRARTGRGAAQRYRAMSADHDEAVRRRRNTANRILAILRAALTTAWREGKVPSDQAWRRVKPFENVTSARMRYLTIPECTRLINGCDPNFRLLVRAALESGCRYGELGRLKVHDFNPDSGTLAILRSKTGKARHVVLTDEGAAFFSQLCAGRAGLELMLRRSSGEHWGMANQTAPLTEACRRAGISPAANFHCLRHTYASHAVMNGAPLHVVAKNLGHADTRMVERHYGHLAPSYIADAIRAAAPKFGIKSECKVASIEGRGQV